MQAVVRRHTTMVHLAFWSTVEFSEEWEPLSSPAVGETHPVPSLEFYIRLSMSKDSVVGGKQFNC